MLFRVAKEILMKFAKSIALLRQRARGVDPISFIIKPPEY
jgi:hypothetical protein